MSFPSPSPLTGDDEPVFFTLGKFDFTASTSVAQWITVFALPAAYLTILLLAIIIDLNTCARICARLRFSSGRALQEMEETSNRNHHMLPLHHRHARDRAKEKEKEEKNERAKGLRRGMTEHNSSTAQRKALQNRAIAQKAFVFGLVKDGKVFLGPKTMFLMHKRQFERFRPEFVHATVPKATRLLRTPYIANRKTLYCTFINTVFATALRPSIIITCLAGIWAWGVYAFRSMVSDETLAYIDTDQASDNAFGTEVVMALNDTTEENIAYFLQNLDRMAGLTALVQSYMSFMLVFYALQSLVLWGKTYAEMRRVAIEFENLGLFFSNFNMAGDKRTRQVKWTMFRYLNMLHFFMYASNVEFLMSDFKNILTRQMARVGLMEQREKEMIDDSQFPIATINSWITNLIWDRSQWLGPRLARLRLLDMLSKINARYTDLSVTMNSSPPYSWAQLMRLLVDVYLILTPFAFVSDMYMPTSEVQIWPIVGTFIVCMFLQGVMAFVRFQKQPFGNGVDAFNPDALLLQVEERLMFWLSYENSDPIYSPDSPEMRFRALARARAEAAKKAAKEKPEEFFGMD